MESQLYRKLALLTDNEAELCLNNLLNGLTIRHPEYLSLLTSPAKMAEALNSTPAGEANTSVRIDEPSPQERPAAIRLILSEIAEDEELGPKLEAVIDNQRNTLLEPVTTAVVLAGIIMALSTSVEIEYGNEDGKRKFKLKIVKPTTTEKLLGKFFRIFK